MRAAPFLFFLCLFVFPVAGQAQFKMCNQTSYVLDATLAERKGKIWQTRGWFRIYPGFCEVVIKKALKKKVFYVHARSAFEQSGRVQLFGGSKVFCVAPRPESFLIKGRILCREKGHEKTGFARIEFEKNRWTHHFQENRPFHTSNHAMVAGVQRLLRTNGFEIGDVDGYWGRLTQRTIQQFQRSIQKRATGVINQKLFDQLLENAGGQQGIHWGFKLCNETTYQVWASIGYRAADEEKNLGEARFESKGWVRLPPKSCGMMLREKLAQPRYYIYAEAVDRQGAIIYKSSGQPLTWIGDFSMCLQRLQFKIKRRRACEERGHQSARFRRIETRGRPGWTEYIYEGEKAL